MSKEKKTTNKCDCKWLCKKWGSLLIITAALLGSDECKKDSACSLSIKNAGISFTISN